MTKKRPKIVRVFLVMATITFWSIQTAYAQVSNAQSVDRLRLGGSEKLSQLDHEKGALQYFGHGLYDDEPLLVEDVTRRISELRTDIATMQQLGLRSKTDHANAIGRGLNYTPLPPEAAEYVGNVYYPGVHGLLFRYAELLERLPASSRYLDSLQKLAAYQHRDSSADLLGLHNELNFLLSTKAANNWAKILQRCAYPNYAPSALCVDPFGNFYTGQTAYDTLDGVFADAVLRRLGPLYMEMYDQGQLDAEEVAALKTIAKYRTNIMIDVAKRIARDSYQRLIDVELATSGGQIDQGLIERAVGGDVAAMNDLSDAYAALPEQTRDVKGSITIWRKRAMDAGSPGSLYEQAKLYKRHSLKQVALLKRASESGSDTARLDLARAYMDASSPAHDLGAAIDLLLPISTADNCDAARLLGRAFESRQAGPQDRADAISAYRICQHVPRFDGQCDLAELLLQRQQDSDVDEAAEIYTNAYRTYGPRFCRNAQRDLAKISSLRSASATDKDYSDQLFYYAVTTQYDSFRTIDLTRFAPSHTRGQALEWIAKGCPALSSREQQCPASKVVITTHGNNTQLLNAVRTGIQAVAKNQAEVLLLILNPYRGNDDNLLIETFANGQIHYYFKMTPAPRASNFTEACRIAEIVESAAMTTYTERVTKNPKMMHSPSGNPTSRWGFDLGLTLTLNSMEYGDQCEFQ